MKVPIVDENDNLIKIIDSKDRMPGEICRASGLWVTNEKEEILLAKRAEEKEVSPGLWGPAAAGTVEGNETYEECIIREAEEEIGLFNIKFTLGPKVYLSTSHQYFGQWYTVIVDSSYPFIKQDSEVAEIRWFTKEEILKMYEEGPNLFIPSFGRTVEIFISDENKN